MATCLVLGAGGISGIAWETGLLAALVEDCVHLADIDSFIGTSAGAVVAAQLAWGIEPSELFSGLLSAEDSHEQFKPYSRKDTDTHSQKLLQKFNGDINGARQRIGVAAVRSSDASTHKRRAIIQARLSSSSWPNRVLSVTAVDTESGIGRVFTKADGVDFIDAVTASCAVPGTWPAVNIEGRLYMDGGIRSLTNADFAKGRDHVIILAPLGYGDANPICGHLRVEVAALRAAGSDVLVVIPDANSEEAIGDNVLDPARRKAAARAGYEQGRALATAWSAEWK